MGLCWDNGRENGSYYFGFRIGLFSKSRCLVAGRGFLITRACFFFGFCLGDTGQTAFIPIRHLLPFEDSMAVRGLVWSCMGI